MIPFQKLNLRPQIISHSPDGISFNGHKIVPRYQLGTWKTHDDDDDNDTVYLYNYNV